MRLRRVAPVMGVLALAAVLRFWALDQGLPFPNSRPDEREAVLKYTLGFSQGDWNPRMFVYPNFYYYLTWAWGEVALAVRRLLVPTPSYNEVYTTAVPLLLLVGRALSALVGTLTVWLTYRIGRHLGGDRLGVVAGILLATNFLHARDSHALKPDVLLAFGVLASLGQLARFVSAPSTRRALVAGVAIGLTTAVKYNGLFLLVPAYVAGWVATPAVARRWLPGRDVWLIAAAAGATFVLTCPFLVLDLSRTQYWLSFGPWAIYASRPHAALAAAVGPLARARLFLESRAFAHHLLFSLRHGAGLAATLATPAAILLALRRPWTPFFVLAAVFSLAYYLAIGLSPVHLARYFTPLTPLLALLVAQLLILLVRPLHKSRLQPLALATLTLLFALEPTRANIAHNQIGSRTDTRVQAASWMETHLPPGAVVAMPGTIFSAGSDPELPAGARKLAYGIGPEQYAGEGVTHVVTHWHHELLRFSQPNPGLMRLLKPHLRPLAEFSPFVGPPSGHFENEDAYYIPFYGFSGVERPGPLVRIFAYTP